MRAEQDWKPKDGADWKKKAIQGWKPKETAGYWETKPRDDTSQKEMESGPECEPIVYRNHGDTHSYRILGTSSICVGYIQAVGSHMVLETIERCEPFRNGNHKELRVNSLWRPRKIRAK